MQIKPDARRFDKNKRQMIKKYTCTVANVTENGRRSLHDLHSRQRDMS
ncbi:MAG: hypothetical protein KJZ95_15975 [Caldilinea sp.]|nr:hypothetical protein [Caldilinea sp.]